MKRLALLVASVAALVLFTACPNKPAEDAYYSEDIALRWQAPESGVDTVMYFRQEFTMNGNTLIYNPDSPVNSERPYVYFSNLDNPICAIVNDTIWYFTRIDAAHTLGNEVFKQVTAKVNWSGKKRDQFTFSYVLPTAWNAIVSATHTCNRIKSLSE